MTEKILVTHKIHDEVWQRLAVYGQVEMNLTSEPWSYHEVSRRIGNATAMMGFMTERVDSELLAAAPALKIIACALKGYDSYDLAACATAGIWLSIVPDLLTEPTAELALGLAISLARHLRHGDEFIRTRAYHGWRPHFYGKGLNNSVVALVGGGRVGRAIGKRLSGFACREILIVDPALYGTGEEFVTLEAALAVADFVFLAVPLTPQSLGLINDETLSNIKPGQLMINVGRGSVVDELAIARALQEGRLGGYAADVFACEDWSLKNHPRAIPQVLLQSERTLFTPHLGSAVTEVRLAIEHRAADNIIACLTGEFPPDAVVGPQTAREIKQESAVTS